MSARGTSIHEALRGRQKSRSFCEIHIGHRRINVFRRRVIPLRRAGPRQIPAISGLYPMLLGETRIRTDAGKPSQATVTAKPAGGCRVDPDEPTTLRQTGKVFTISLVGEL